MAETELPSFHGIVGRSAAMQELYRRIGRVGPIDVPVLILGESGTGKELVARAIQQLSGRNLRPFEIVNCGALTRELLPSELFGHERGAFTGAIQRKPGLIALADSGTVFLDEVGELPPDAQAMLLRFLQDGELRSVGSTRTVKVDVRLISATHRDLDAAIEQGRFREDLYYRLCDIVLEVPPLRERREDIPLLVEHLRVAINRRHGLAIEPVQQDVLDALANAPWPGNVRELEKVLKQAMILRGAGVLRREDLRPQVWRRPGSLAHVTSHADRQEGARLPAPPRGEAALKLAGARGAVTRRELARACGISVEVARQELLVLTRLGYLRRVGRGRATRYVPQ